MIRPHEYICPVCGRIWWSVEAYRRECGKAHAADPPPGSKQAPTPLQQEHPPLEKSAEKITIYDSLSFVLNCVRGEIWN